MLLLLDVLSFLVLAPLRVAGLLIEVVPMLVFAWEHRLPVVVVILAAAVAYCISGCTQGRADALLWRVQQEHCVQASLLQQQEQQLAVQRRRAELCQHRLVAGTQLQQRQQYLAWELQRMEACEAELQQRVAWLAAQERTCSWWGWWYHFTGQRCIPGELLRGSLLELQQLRGYCAALAGEKASVDAQMQSFVLHVDAEMSWLSAPEPPQRFPFFGSWCRW